MNSQTQIQFNVTTARARRDDGMKRAETKANAMHDGWSEKALEFLKGYAEINPKFMGEDVRYAAQGIVPPAKSQRAWGAIIQKAVRLGWIHNHNRETSQVKNAKANCANAAVWKSLICLKH